MTPDFDKILLDPALAWTEIPGPEDHPEARAFQAESGPWKFLVLGAPPGGPDGTPCSCGGSAASVEKGQVFFLPLPLVWAAWEIAVKQNPK